MIGSVEIKDIFKKDITRKINGVVKADQNSEEIIITELSEYVVTEELRKHFQKFFDRYVNSLNNPTEDMGVWISGFYGSGKSHFLKMIGRILENKEYNGKKVSDFFKEKIEDAILQGNIEKSSEVPTDVILFNVDNVSDQDTYQNKDSIVVAFLKNFNAHLGFEKNNLKVAEFERKLWEDGKLEEFKNIFKEIAGKTWKDAIRNLDFYQDDFIETVVEMELMSEDSAERWLEKDDKISVTPESFADLLEYYLKIKGPKHRIVFLVDEIGQYIGDNSQLMLNLQTLVEVLGVKFQGRIWVGVTSQQDLGHILTGGEHRKNDFSKIQDRFKTILSLSSGNIDEVIKRRLLEKKKIDSEELEKIYDENNISIKNIINFEKNSATLPIYKDKSDFAETYPFIDYQFSMLQKVFEKVRDMGYSGQHMSRGERSLLSSFQEASIRIKDEKVGALVPFNYFFESIEQFLEDIAKRPFIIAKNERGVDDFELEVLKLLFLLKGIKEISSNITNIVSLMIDSIDCDRIELETKVKKALIKLEKEVLIEKEGENYYFLTNEEQDINKEIAQEQFEYNEIYRQIDSYIFGDIFTKNSIISEETGNKYTFSRKIDEFNMSKKGEQLDIVILTPSADEYNTVQLLGTRGGEYELIVRLPENEKEYLEEIKQSLKVESYIKRKNGENNREIISQILSSKQRENQKRKERIRRSLEEALLEADIFVYGEKISLTKTSSGAKVIEEALKAGARHRFKSASLIQVPYDEARIKSLLTYNFGEDSTLFTINRELDSNPNREAIREVKSRIENLTARGMNIIVKDLVDYYMKAPYGWSLFSVNGIIAELWVYRIINIEESKEVVKRADQVKDLLTKSQTRFLERIVITLKEEIDTELIKKVNNILKELFGNSFEITSNSPKDDFIKIIEGRKNIANSHLRECEAKQYPGTKELKEWIEILEEILDLKSDKTEKVLKEFIKQKDDFSDLYYSQSDVEEFLTKNKKVKFDEARNKIKSIEENLGYMKNIKETEAFKELVSIVNDKKPYSRIRNIDDLLSNIGIEEKKIIENEKDILKEKSKNQENRLKNIFKEKNEFLEKISIEFKKFNEKIEDIKDIKNIMSDTKELENIAIGIENQYKKYIKSEIENIKSDVLKTLDDKEDSENLIKEIKESYDTLKSDIDLRKIDEVIGILEVAEKDKEQFILQGNGKAKKKERIKLRKINVLSKHNIETEEDIKEYINSIEKEIEKLKEDMLKAINENKIIDII